MVSWITKKRCPSRYPAALVDLVTPDGHTVPGTYTVGNGQICLTPTGGQQACTEYVGEKNVGDTWTQSATNGSTVTITLQAGR